jgi:Amt family ammonium transporter
MANKILSAVCVAGAFLAAPAFAQDAVVALPEPDSGDSAWILTSSALVLLMTLPGLALFYGGLVRAKNFLSVLVQCGAIAAMASVIWIAVGYSLAFSVNGNSYIGSPENFMFNGLLDSVREDQTIGELAFALFQMTFAIITPALIVGAWVRRACALCGWVRRLQRASGCFAGLHAPVTRWVWGGGWLAGTGRQSTLQAASSCIRNGRRQSRLLVVCVDARQAHQPSPTTFDACRTAPR